MPLFRPEALGAHDRLYGDVQLVPPISQQVVGYFLLISIVAATIFLSLASFSETLAATGYVTGASDRVTLDIPADVASRIHPGEPVRIALDAFPAPTFGTIEARIVALSSTTMPTTDSDGRRHDVFVATAQLGHGTIVALGRPQPLRPSMTITGQIETGRRSLFAWLFDPMPPSARR